MATRRCSGGCQRILARRTFSNTQWKKGPGRSRCPDCIAKKTSRAKTNGNKSQFQSVQVNIGDKVFVKEPSSNESRLALVLNCTHDKVYVQFDGTSRSGCVHRSCLDPRSVDRDNNDLINRMSGLSLKTSDISLVSHTHGRNRRAERDIAKKNLQRAIKYGKVESSRPGQDGRPRQAHEPTRVHTVDTVFSTIFCVH